MRARLHKDLRGYSDKMKLKLYLIIDYPNEFQYFFLQFSEKYFSSELRSNIKISQIFPFGSCSLGLKLWKSIWFTRADPGTAGLRKI